MEGYFDKIMRTLKSIDDLEQYPSTRQWAKDLMVKGLMFGDISIVEVEELNEYINNLDELLALNKEDMQ